MIRDLVIAALALAAIVVPVATVPECAHEGSQQTVCVWDAQTRGNGEGQSFVKVGNVYVPFGGYAK